MLLRKESENITAKKSSLNAFGTHLVPHEDLVVIPAGFEPATF